MVREMKHAYEEQQSNEDEMIRQVALLTAMMKEIQENRAKFEVSGKTEVEEGVRGAEEKEPAEAEKKSEALPEEVETEEIESDEEEKRSEEKSMTSPPEDGAPREIPEEACDQSHESEEAIECNEGIDNTLFFLHPDKVHAPEEKVEEFTTVVKEESTPIEKPPPVVDELEGCSYEEEEPEWKEEERTRRKGCKSYELGAVTAMARTAKNGRASSLWSTSQGK